MSVGVATDQETLKTANVRDGRRHTKGTRQTQQRLEKNARSWDNVMEIGGSGGGGGGGGVQTQLV